MSKNKMLIDASHTEETRVVVLKDNKVEEFDFESAARKLLKGSIFLAKVTRVEPSLQAAFVDYGGNRHGFLAFNEIHADYYQIPVADRQALLEAEAAARAEEERAEAEADARAEAEEAAKAASKSASRKRRSRASDDADDNEADVDGDDVVEAVDADADDKTDDRDDHVETVADPLSDDEIDVIEATAVDVTEIMPEAGEDHDDAEDHNEVADDVGSYDEASETPAKALAVKADERLTADADGAEADTADAEADDAETDADDQDDDREPTVEAADDEADADGDAETDGEPEAADASDAPSDDEVEAEVAPRRPSRRRMRTYKIQEVIKRRQIVLVQVVKEERGTKGAALTTYLSLAGRYTVLMPNTARGGGISRKITNSADRKRLKAIAEELDVPEGMGLIIRTAGASRTKQEIKRDFEYLLRLWESVRDLTLESSAPTLVYEEGNLIKRSIRDLYSKDTDEIVVAGEEAYREAKDFMRMLMPSHAKNVVRFSDPGSLFSKFRIESQLGAMFSPIVTLPSGGYLVINQTEALVAIDINSGRATREFSIEETALKTNLEAAEEIARQLKLRDLAGLIVIDFIDMDEKRNNRSVERRVKDCLKLDRARIQVGRISHFGLLEMSRQRLRTGVLEGSTTQCPHCQGTGIVRSIPSVALAVLRGIEDALERGAGSLKVQCAPEVAFYLLNEKRQFLNELEDQFECRIMVNGSDAEQGASFSIDSENDMAPRPEPQRSRRRDAVSMGRGNEAEDEATASTDEDDEERRPRRRRRRRGGRGRDSGAEDDANGLMAADDGDDDGESDVGEEAVADGDADGDQPSRGRRSRKRGRRGGQRNRGQSANGADLDVSAPDAPQPDIAGSDFSGEGEEDDGDGDTSYAAQAGTIVSAANAIRRRSGNEGRRSNGDGRGRGRGRRGARANAESDQQAANASDDTPLENGAVQADDGNPDVVGSPEQTNAQFDTPATSTNGAAETHEVEASASVNGANGSTATKAANGEASVADEPAKTADADADTETAEAAPPPKPRAHWGEPKVSAPTIETVTLAPETPDAEVPPVETDKPQRRGWWQRNFG